MNIRTCGLIAVFLAISIVRPLSADDNETDWAGPRGMTAQEIFNRLKAQASETSVRSGGSSTRGLSVSYGNPGPRPSYTIREAGVPVTRVELYSSVDTARRVNISILFDRNSASLKPATRDVLAELCTAIQTVGVSVQNRFKIVGHTDKSGRADYNLRLSDARAREVRRYLIEECDLVPSKLIAVGEGERQSPPDTPAISPNERRVEIQFVS